MSFVDKRELSESAIQIQLIDILKLVKRDDVEIIGIKNEGRRSFRTAAKMKAEGLTAGVPDILIMRPAVEGGLAWLELKNRKGSLSVAQHGFAAKCRRLGVPWAMARSVDEALAYLRGLNVLKPNAVIL